VTVHILPKRSSASEVGCLPTSMYLTTLSVRVSMTSILLSYDQQFVKTKSPYCTICSVDG